MMSDNLTDDVKQIEKDIWLVVGGNFTPDSIGPDAYNATIARIRSQSNDYLNVLESLFMGPNFDAQLQSNLYLPAFLSLISDLEPERVHKVAEKLLKQFNDMMVIYDQTSDKRMLSTLLPEDTISLTQRLEQRRMQLKALLK